MLKLHISEIKNVEMSKLRLNFGVKDRASRSGTTLVQAWNEGRRRAHRENITKVMGSIDSKGEGASLADVFGRIKNEAIKWGSNVMMAGKVEKGRYALVVWASDTCSSVAVGTNLEQTAREARADWTQKFVNDIREKGVQTVLNAWWTFDREDGARWIPLMRHWHGNEWYELIDPSILPAKVKEVTAEAIKDDRQLSEAPWRVVRQVVRYRHKKSDKRKIEEFKTRTVETDELFASISKQCLLDSGTSCVSIWKGGEKEWAVDGREVLSRLIYSVESRLPVIGFDSEGREGCYRQVGWVGEYGMEAAMFGLNFFPVFNFCLCFPYNFILFFAGRSEKCFEAA